jgi:hypothetical protein
LQRTLEKRDGNERHWNLVGFEKLFGDLDVLVGDGGDIEIGWFFVLVRFAQILTVQRAIERLLALGSAAKGTDLAVNGRAGAALFTDIANGARHVPSIGSEAKGPMRTNLFIKVMVEHDEKEPPEKLGAELCRQLERNYIVRDAELSSYAPVED